MQFSVRLSAAFREHGEETRASAELLPPPPRPLHLPEFDADALPEGDHPISSTLLFIRYRDSRGGESARYLTAKRLGKHGGNLTISGTCHQRNAYRCFRVDRIRELIDPDSGEVFDDAEQFIRAVLMAEDGKGAALEQALERSRDMLNALAFLARCDDDYDVREQMVISHVLADLCPDLDYDPAEAARRIALLRPDFDEFIDSVEAIAGTSDEMALKLAHAAIDVVAADGVHREQERRFLHELTDALDDGGHPVTGLRR